MSMRMPHFAFLPVVLWLLLQPTLLLAHGDEDHGDHQAAPADLASSLPKAEAISDSIELLAILNGTELTVYLDQADSNQPITEATLEISRDQHSLQAREIHPGVYQAQADWLADPVLHNLVFSVEAATLFDLLDAHLDLRPPPTAAPSTFTGHLRHWLGATPAVSAPATAVTETPRRLPDGRLFIPKASQRLLNIRTIKASPGHFAGRINLNGRILADPTTSGIVQAGQEGRLEATAEGWPHLGQKVEKGDVLALLAPLASSLERGNQEAALAALDSQLTLAQKRQQRLDTLTGSVPQKDIDAARQAVVSLRQRRTALANSLYRKVPLRAPVTGVIGNLDVVAGQVVNANTPLFSLLQPDRLWVEAQLYDPALPLQTAHAHLQLGNLTAPLEFMGAAAALRDQALPLQFRILPPVPPLAVGQAVSVLVSTHETRTGVAVPATSLGRGSDGLPNLWLHESAELFRPLPVTTALLDGQHLLITSPLPTGSRIVANGATSLDQIR